MLYVSSLGTSSCLGIHLFGSVTKSINAFGIGMRIIILTGKGLYTLNCTGRISGYNAIVPSVTGGRNSFLCNGSCICTGFILEYAATCATCVVFVVTGCGTGSCLCFGLDHAVTKCRYLAISGVIAYLTILVCVPTKCGTGSCLCCYCRNIVTGGRNGFLRNGGCTHAGFILEYLVTSIAGVVFVVTGRCTSCRLSVGLDHLVTKSCLFNVGCVGASRTGYVCIPSDLSTGRSLCLVSNLGVTKCIYNGLCCQNLVTYGALNSCGKTGFSTSCRYCRYCLIGMALSGNNLISSLCLCP